LVKAFSGKGLVPASVTANPAFLLAVGLGAALTVFLATITGFPISTTHALTGALVGAGWMAAGWQINGQRLIQAFFLPLAFSPVAALGITAAVYPFFRTLRQRLGIQKQLCLCVGPQREPVLLRSNGTAVLASTGSALTVGELSTCVEQYQGVLFGLDGQRVLDAFHAVSAGVVSFARGLNDTPKITALLIAAPGLSLDPRIGLGSVAVAMALGGLLNARRVAQTMSQRITRMNHGQGFTANGVTGLLVLGASCFGLPVSTTHVSCGALFGIGQVSRQGRPDVIRNVILSWFVTLPVSMGLGTMIYGLL
jgi:PiT family inorganic phosphate transporter